SRGCDMPRRPTATACTNDGQNEYIHCRLTTKYQLLNPRAWIGIQAEHKSYEHAIPVSIRSVGTAVDAVRRPVAGTGAKFGAIFVCLSGDITVRRAGKDCGGDRNRHGL